MTAERTEPQRPPAQDGRRVLDVFPEHDGGELGNLSAETREHLLNVVTFDQNVIASRRRNDDWRRTRVWIGSSYTKVNEA